VLATCCRLEKEDLRICKRGERGSDFTLQSGDVSSLQRRYLVDESFDRAAGEPVAGQAEPDMPRSPGWKDLNPPRPHWEGILVLRRHPRRPLGRTRGSPVVVLTNYWRGDCDCDTRDVDSTRGTAKSQRWHRGLPPAAIRSFRVLRGLFFRRHVRHPFLSLSSQRSRPRNTMAAILLSCYTRKSESSRLVHQITPPWFGRCH
jgi:hypothetical protein